MIKSAFPMFVGAALLSVSSFTFAIPVDGGISFSGEPGDFSFTENEVIFDSSSPNAEVDQVSGDFQNYYAPGDKATFSSFSYDPFSGGGTLWEAESSKVAGTTLQLNLAELTNVSKGTSTSLLEGTGAITDGDDQAFGLWNLTMNQGGDTFSWSSSASVSEAADVPEPGTIGLLGLGMVLLGLRAYRAV